MHVENILNFLFALISKELTLVHMLLASHSQRLQCVHWQMAALRVILPLCQKRSTITDLNLKIVMQKKKNPCPNFAATMVSFCKASQIHADVLHIPDTL